MCKYWMCLLLVGSLNAVVWADNPVCVRDYKTREGSYACDRFATAYAWVFPESRAVAKVCTRMYKSSFCQTAPKQYVEVPATDGSVVCVMNFNQPPANLCDSMPALYQYILHKAP